MSIDAGRPHHRDVTPPEERDVTDRGVTPHVMNAGEARIVTALRDEKRVLRERADDLEKQLFTRTLEAERLRAWLVEILLRCKGSAPGLVGQAINSTDWPRGRGPSSETHATAPGKDHDHVQD